MSCHAVRWAANVRGRRPSDRVPRRRIRCQPRCNSAWALARLCGACVPLCVLFALSWVISSTLRATSHPVVGVQNFGNSGNLPRWSLHLPPRQVLPKVSASPAASLQGGQHKAQSMAKHSLLAVPAARGSFGFDFYGLRLEIQLCGYRALPRLAKQLLTLRGAARCSAEHAEHHELANQGAAPKEPRPRLVCEWCLANRSSAPPRPSIRAPRV